MSMTLAPGYCCNTMSTIIISATSLSKCAIGCECPVHGGTIFGTHPGIYTANWASISVVNRICVVSPMLVPIITHPGNLGCGGFGGGVTTGGITGGNAGGGLPPGDGGNGRGGTPPPVGGGGSTGGAGTGFGVLAVVVVRGVKAAVVVAGTLEVLTTCGCGCPI